MAGTLRLFQLQASIHRFALVLIRQYTDLLITESRG